VGCVVKANKSYFVILGWLMAGLAASPPAQAGQTYIINSGFEVNSWEETGFPAEWCASPEGTAVYHTHEPSKAHSGRVYVSMTPGPDGWANIEPTSKIPVARDTNYIIAAYVADANGGQTGQNLAGTASLRVDWYANRSDTYESRLGSGLVNLEVPKDGNYYYFSGHVRNSFDANYAQVILAANQVAGQSPVFRFDDVTFAHASPPAKPDFNADKKVNFLDFALLAQGYGKDIDVYDMDGDGSFGFSDFALFTPDWTRTIPDVPGYKFVWSDEFDGTEIDYSNWTHEVGDSWSNGELQSYTDRRYNSVVEDGCLAIIARKEQYGPNNYTSARLRSFTKLDFRYGRMAARIKLPVGQGIWPAFWMMPTNEIYGYWPDSGEIDIIEAVNQIDRIYGTLHFTNTTHQHVSSGGSYYASGLCFADDFHVYAIEWEPGEIRWFVDDVMYYSRTDWSSGTNPYPAPFNDQFYFILNVAVGGSWPGSPDQTTVFPQRMLVDWVRVYKKIP
jgi:hypothetical protein